MNIALFIIYLLTGVGLLLAAYLHGKPQTDYNFWVSLIARGISLTLIWWALGWKFI